jgi:hypothetical protein
VVQFPSFSIFSSRSMTARRYIFVVFLTSIIPILTLFGMNLLVDPYNELGIRVVPYLRITVTMNTEFYEA